jgi:SAM-dependent MidA family methyltransferase
VHFVETSPALHGMQKAAVPKAHWHGAIGELPAKPLLLIANEFLDALPIRQHVDGVERRIFVAAGGLAFDRDGETVESSPARDKAVAAMAGHLAANGGVALIVDYGHERTSPGDTLQAVRDHQYAPILADPGEHDLTSHVDFEAVGNAARGAGAAVTPLVLQGEWLIRLGIEARAQALSRVNPDRAQDLQSALDRLTGRDQMGQLFKVIALHSPEWPAPGGFA